MNPGHSEPVSLSQGAPQTNGSLVGFQNRGSFLPLPPLEPSAEGTLANVSKHESRSHTLAPPPSPQREAVAVLQECENVEIFNWLSILRSLASKCQQSSQSGILSQTQLGALSALKDCRNDDIAACLEASRQGSFDGRQAPLTDTNITSERAKAPFSSDTWHKPSGPLPGMSGTSSFCDSPENSANTPRSSLSHPNSLVELFRTNSHVERASPVSAVTPQYWCTVCPNPIPMTTCEGWKRHEKEIHEQGYICMPNGPIEATESGPRCAFCWLPHPDRTHLEKHATNLCEHKSRQDRKYPRKAQLINHLKVHTGIDATALADKWRVSLRKRYHACGFCVSVFSSIGARLNHIDKEHWRHFQSIDGWDFNVVIRSLLLQPEVLADWEAICTWDPDPRSANLTWDPRSIGKLQLELEMSEKSAHELARDAFYQSNYGNCETFRAMPVSYGSVPGHHAMEDELLSFGRQEDPLVPTLSSYSSHDFNDINTSTLPLQARQPSWVDAQTQQIPTPIQLGIHPPQTLEAVREVEMANSYLPVVATQSDQYQDASPASHDFSNIGTAFAHIGDTLSQDDSTTVVSWQDSSSRYAALSDATLAPQGNPSDCGTGLEVSQDAEVRPVVSHSTQNRSNPSFSTTTTPTGSAKPASKFRQVKRRLSRLRMGIDFDEIMGHMQDDETSRSDWPADRRSK